MNKLSSLAKEKEVRFKAYKSKIQCVTHIAKVVEMGIKTLFKSQNRTLGNHDQLSQKR
jgi:hypothetical protein